MFKLLYGYFLSSIYELKNRLSVFLSSCRCIYIYVQVRFRGYLLSGKPRPTFSVSASKTPLWYLQHGQPIENRHVRWYTCIYVYMM